MSLDYEVEISNEQKFEQAEDLLSNDFQYYLEDALAPRVGRDHRNELLKPLVDEITSKRSTAAFAALGEMLYLWAEEEAIAEVERNCSPHPVGY